MADYIVNFTDINVSPITIPEGEMDTTSLDISLFGRIRLEYGEFLNESLLHILENFAAPESITSPGIPDTDNTHNNILSNPTVGQFWYNSTDKRLYSWDGMFWVPLRGGEEIGANWGSISNGQQLPRPVSPTTGYQFEYDECIWSVAPAGYDGEFGAMSCGTTEDATVTMEYKFKGSDFVVEGFVNYLIIGIRNNANQGTPMDPTSLPDVTLTPTPTVTPTSGLVASPTPTPNPTPGVTITPSSPAITPSPSPVSAFATNARLFISPAPCDPGTPGPGGTDTFNRSTCGTVSRSAYDQSMYVSIQGLSGGVPPYSVDFTYALADDNTGVWGGLITFNPYDPNYTGSISDQTYNGDFSEFSVGFNPSETIVLRSYHGGTANPLDSKIRENLAPGEIAYMRCRHSAQYFYTGYDFRGGIVAWGRVIARDNVGNTRQWWIPASGQDYPAFGYTAGCPVGGTNLTQPGTNGPFGNGTTLYWFATWRHWGIPNGSSIACNNCEPGDCVV